MMEKLKCVRCGHEWIARLKTHPRRCPGCSAPYWWRPARVRKEHIQRPVGAPPKYPFHTLEVGQNVLIPSFMLGPWDVDERKNLSLISSMRSYAKRSGKKFFHEMQGVRHCITRLA